MKKLDVGSGDRGPVSVGDVKFRLGAGLPDRRRGSGGETLDFPWVGSSRRRDSRKIPVCVQCGEGSLIARTV